METTVRIDGKDVRFKATAAVPLLYRNEFNRDVLTDMRAAVKEMGGDDQDGLPVKLQIMLGRLAYVMAKHANPGVEAKSPAEWIAEFSPMFIYRIAPVIQALWAGNMERLEEAKKKLGQSTGSSPQPCSCSGPCSSECRCET